jgi:hypothetical protein
VIVGSLLLILVAVALLAFGLLQGANSFLVGSVSASLLAALALIVGGRKFARTADGEQAAREGEPASQRRARAAVPVEAAPDEPDVVVEPVEELVTVGRSGRRPRAEGSAIPIQMGGEPESSGAPVRFADDDLARLPERDDETDEYDDDDPPDEPPSQPVSPADAARVARMDSEVLVIDGRPRYHQSGCVHLLGRQSEPLPVSEAIELGFTPCGRCEPDSALLAQARRV